MVSQLFHLRGRMIRLMWRSRGMHFGRQPSVLQQAVASWVEKEWVSQLRCQDASSVYGEEEVWLVWKAKGPAVVQLNSEPEGAEYRFRRQSHPESRRSEAPCRLSDDGASYDGVRCPDQPRTARLS